MFFHQWDSRNFEIYPKTRKLRHILQKKFENVRYFTHLFFNKSVSFFANFYKVTPVISRLKVSVKFKNSQNRWIFGVNSWKLRKKFQWNSKIRRKGEFLALILENYAWGQFLPCLTNSMSVHIKILLYQYNLVYLQFIRQKYHEKDHFLGHFPYIDNDNDLLSLYSFQKLLGRVSFSFKVCLIDQMRFGQQMYCWQPFYTTWNKKKQGISRKNKNFTQ